VLESAAFAGSSNPMKHPMAAWFWLCLSVLPVCGQTDSSVPVLHIHAAEVTGKVSSVFSGMMTEEINHSYDGGLYAELLQNRALKDDPANPVHWSAVQEGSVAAVSLDGANGLNAVFTPSLRLDVTAASPGVRAGVANDGFWGIPVKPAAHYRASFYAKAANGFTGPVDVTIESPDGFTVFAQAQVKGIGANWQRYSVVLTTSRRVEPTARARFVLAVHSPGTVWFDLVSLFPPTWNKRPNGNRIDIMQTLAGMAPKFLRFPGGNYLEGSSIASRFQWKETLGSWENRAGHEGCWGYRSSDGMGLLEFLEWAEDLKAEPVLAVYAGFSLPPKAERIKPGPDLQPFVQEALDEIEYVIGDKHTKWGARRVADGHPAPFKLSYVEIGNEEWFDNSGSYDGRFTQFYDAIKSKYPQLQCISTVGNEQPAKKRVHSRRPDVVDEHYYLSADSFEREAPSRFERYDRSEPKIFVGEWGAFEDTAPWKNPSGKLPPTPTFKATLGDAAWMTAMERNADIIVMQCYAPMLVNVNPGARQWRPNLIGYDALTTQGSPTYYAMAMFNTNRGDAVVRASLEGLAEKGKPPLDYSVTKDTKHGIIYIHMVNVTATNQVVEIQLEGVKKVRPQGLSIILSSSRLDAANTLEDSSKVLPVVEKIDGLAVRFTKTFAPHSITVLKIQTKS